MRAFLLSLSLLLSAACASTSTTVAKPQVPNTDAVVQLAGRYLVGAAACPVTPTFALTADHVISVQLGDRGIQPPVQWEDGLGNAGTANPIDRFPSVDLAGYGGDFTLTVPVGAEPPKKGDRVFWVEFSWESEDSAFERVVRSGVVTRVVAHHIIFKNRAPVPGASGSCLFNEKGEVIGIISLKVAIGWTGSVGRAVGVWGFPLPEEEQK
jgi:hypothetical protein